MSKIKEIQQEQQWQSAKILELNTEIRAFREVAKIGLENDESSELIPDKLANELHLSNLSNELFNLRYYWETVNLADVVLFSAGVDFDKSTEESLQKIRERFIFGNTETKEQWLKEVKEKKGAEKVENKGLNHTLFPLDLGLYIWGQWYLGKIVLLSLQRDKIESSMNVIADASKYGRAKVSWVFQFFKRIFRNKTLDNQSRGEENDVNNLIRWYSPTPDNLETLVSLNHQIELKREELYSMLGMNYHIMDKQQQEINKQENNNYNLVATQQLLNIKLKKIAKEIPGLIIGNVFEQNMNPEKGDLYVSQKENKEVKQNLGGGIA